jgi:ferredoxin-NADP reductase
MAAPRKLRCQIGRATDHGDHVYTIELEPETTPPAFRPGQFLHLALDDYDPSRFWPESRVFSIASPPSTLPLRISYSVRGRYTARMEKELTTGSHVWIKLPYGEFVVSPIRPSVLLAGGTGITAFTAFIAGLKPDLDQPVFLAYGARRPELLIYHDVVEQQAAAVPSFRHAFFSEAPTHQLPLKTGCVSVDAIWPLLTAPADSSFFVSGPPAMLRAVVSDLETRGVRPTAIHTDAWE